jgi:hypothetical protein
VGTRAALDDVNKYAQVLSDWQEQRDSLRAKVKELEAEREALDLSEPGDVADAMDRMAGIVTQLSSIHEVEAVLEGKIKDAAARLQAARDVLRQEQLAKSEPKRDAALVAVKDAVKALSEAMSDLDEANKEVQSLGGGAVTFKGYRELSRKVAAAVAVVKAMSKDRMPVIPEPPREQIRRVWNPLAREWRIGTFRSAT